jgi:hypothetical protein
MISNRARQQQHPILVRTIADLGERTRLFASCPRCHCTRALDVDALRARYGARLSLRRLASMLRCTRCGARGCGVMQVFDNREQPSKLEA